MFKDWYNLPILFSRNTTEIYIGIWEFCSIVDIGKLLNIDAN